MIQEQSLDISVALSYTYYVSSDIEKKIGISGVQSKIGY